jgi:hypothetical protein
MLKLFVHGSKYGHATIVWQCFNSLVMQQSYGHATIVRLRCNTYSQSDKWNDSQNDILNESIVSSRLKSVSSTQ